MSPSHIHVHRRLSRSQFTIVQTIAHLLPGRCIWDRVLDAARIARRRARLVRAYSQARQAGVTPHDIYRFIFGDGTPF